MSRGVVLAGRRSSRTGTGKAGLTWRGQPLLGHMQELLQAGAECVPASCPRAGDRGLPDKQPDPGPLSGLAALAQPLPDGIYLLTPVGIPLLTASLIEQPVAAVTNDVGESCRRIKPSLPPCLRVDARVQAATVGQPRRTRSLCALQSARGAKAPVLPMRQEDLPLNCNTPEQWRKVMK